MTEPASIESLLTISARLTELYRVTHYKGVRTDKAGHTGFVDIEIWESDPPTGHWYDVNAKDTFGREASGNGHENLRAAILTVHWGDLDAEPHGEPND